ncbi:MAG: metal ABC transporter permease, partial [Elusimicrobia bacterium]|nr:metal ABC transporter permease [Candidatus Obscuribacterium magneticum]
MPAPFSLPFMQTALLASLLAGSALSLIGIFIFANRNTFSGLSISQFAALGAVIGALLGFHWGNFAVALLFVGCGIYFLNRLSRDARIPADSWIGSFYILGAALSVLILSKMAHGEADTMNIFFGNILSLDWTEVLESAILLLVSIGILLFHENAVTATTPEELV